MSRLQLFALMVREQEDKKIEGYEGSTFLTVVQELEDKVKEKMRRCGRL